MSGGWSEPVTDETIRAQLERLGFLLDERQIADLRRQIDAVEPIMARHRPGTPNPMAAPVDPRFGDLWVTSSGEDR